MTWRALVVGFALLCTAATTTPQTSSVTRTPFVPQTDAYLTASMGEDARILDDRGRTVILRGINVVQIGEYFQNDPAQPPRFDLTEQDMADIAALGFDHIRLILHWSLLEPQPGVRSEAYLRTIRQALDWARVHDLYVVLDMHQDAWGPHVATPPDEVCLPGFDSAVGWDGAPEWATLTDGLPTCKAQLRELSPAVAQAWQSFWIDRPGPDGVGIQTHLVETWGWLVDALGADPVVAGYDLLNEPSPGYLVGVNQTIALGEYYDRVIQDVRRVETTTGRPVPGPVYVEPGVEWSAGSVTVVPPPTFTSDRSVVFAPHIYAESISPVSIEQGWANAVAVAGLYGATVWSGEWGYFSSPPADDDDRLRRFAAEEDRRVLHSAFWDWRQACGDPHNFYPDRSVQTDPSPSLVRYACPGDHELGIPTTFATVLSRPYPRAVPGTLTGIDADIDAGELTVTGRTSTPGVADLWFPDRGTGPPIITGGSDVTVVPVPATDRAAGGWRVQLTVDGDYTIRSARQAPGSTPGSPGDPDPAPTPAPAPTRAPSSPTALPATGGGPWLLGLACMVLAGLLGRRRTGTRGRR